MTLGDASSTGGFWGGACGTGGIGIVPTRLRYCLNHSGMFLIWGSCPLVEMFLAFELSVIFQLSVG